MPEPENCPAPIASLLGLTRIPVVAVCPGIYFLCKDGEVVYVGMSEVVLGRVCTHAAEGRKVFDAVYFIPCPADDLERREAEWIQKLQPKYNVRKKLPAGSPEEGPTPCRVLSFEK